MDLEKKVKFTTIRVYLDDAKLLYSTLKLPQDANISSTVHRIITQIMEDKK